MAQMPYENQKKAEARAMSHGELARVLRGSQQGTLASYVRAEAARRLEMLDQIGPVK